MTWIRCASAAATWGGIVPSARLIDEAARLMSIASKNVDAGRLGPQTQIDHACQTGPLLLLEDGTCDR